MNSIVVIAHNIRSTHNVGAIFRTCDGFGVSQLILTGYTPYPELPDDSRLPHVRRKIAAQIHKTALGAERVVKYTHHDDPVAIIGGLKHRDYTIVALEQAPQAVLLPDFIPPTAKIALVLGEEVHGITPELLNLCDAIVEIPMHGHKESFNVSVAAGIALYALRTVH